VLIVAILGELKTSISQIFGFSADQMHIIKVNTSTAPQVTGEILRGDSFKLQSKFGVENGAILHVEKCTTQASPSRVMKQLELAQYLITVYFNLLDAKTFDQEITMDRRSPFTDFKKKISLVVGVPPDQFKLCKNLVNYEYKTSHQSQVTEDAPIGPSLEEAGLYDGATVLALRGGMYFGLVMI
jgi:hypothetical protein